MWEIFGYDGRCGVWWYREDEKMRLYFRYFAIYLRGLMEYRASFVMTLLSQFVSSFTGVLAVYFMMERFHTVEGFTFPQVLLCFATVLMAFSLAECFFRGFDTFSSMLGNGQFDRMLVRPRGIVFQVVASRVDLSRLGRLLQAVVIFCYALPASGVSWTPDKALTLVLMVVCGMLVFSGLFIIYASICFFTIQGLEFINIFTDGGREFGQYPFVIYGKEVLRFFTYIVPLALFQYYPFLYLIGRSRWRGYMLFPLLSLLFLIPCAVLWRVGLRHYRSTGS